MPNSLSNTAARLTIVTDQLRGWSHALRKSV